MCNNFEICLQNNSYQAIVITDSVSQSYVIFIYECDQIKWSGRDSNHSRVGISDGMGTSYIYPMSGNASIVDIDCLNSPRSMIVNILLDLNTFTLVEPVIPSVISSRMTLPSSLDIDLVSPSVIAMLSTPTQTLNPSVSDSVNLSIMSNPSQTPTPSVLDSVNPSMIAIMPTPSQMLVPVSTVTVDVTLGALNYVYTILEQSCTMIMYITIILSLLQETKKQVTM